MSPHIASTYYPVQFHKLPEKFYTVQTDKQPTMEVITLRWDRRGAELFKDARKPDNWLVLRLALTFEIYSV